MESVKKDNERILKTQEELNQNLMEKFQTEGRSKSSESEEASHHKGSKKMKLAKAESSSSSERSREQQSYHTTSDSSEAELYDRKKKYRPYEDIFGEFKKIKPPTFNGETEKRGRGRVLVMRDEKIFSDIQLFKSVEGKNGHL